MGEALKAFLAKMGPEGLVMLQKILGASGKGVGTAAKGIGEFAKSNPKLAGGLALGGGLYGAKKATEEDPYEMARMQGGM